MLTICQGLSQVVHIILFSLHTFCKAAQTSVPICFAPKHFASQVGTMALRDEDFRVISLGILAT